MRKSVVSGQTCLQSNCHACCLETRMPLTRKDIQRITNATKYNVMELFSEKKDGVIVLKNINKDNKAQCLFLNAQGICTIYELRPEGCCYYPVVWDLDNQKAIVHDFCPYREEFKSEIQYVRRLVERLVINILKETD